VNNRFEFPQIFPRITSINTDRYTLKKAELVTADFLNQRGQKRYREVVNTVETLVL
jgi:hypothetical protein